ncbi:phosphoribosylanthranilate isomerase [Limnobacter sp.]|uniref:phosphoribosylanthranilate isomerase n=2 Tax=Limnobacter sp. TaxID=2003368 RepID=UPI00258EC280|nr:phosphoribosylanthranilate isomerase [Limnobacter sp.]HEX5486684.1 phosphoribosylanthranilate isomerase [Limnobacter sp.]
MQKTMARTRIKICGLKTAQAVSACVAAGADAVGFVFYPPSPRAVVPDLAAELASGLGAWQTPVALFVNPEPTLVNEVIRKIPQVLLQFHGDESPDFCEAFGRPYLKAVRMKDGVDVIKESRRYGRAQALLLDSWSDQYGGSGHAFDWTLLPRQSEMSQPLVLSGGLSANNVEMAISQVAPYGVDVSSGVESARGVKSESLIESFCRAVQLADFNQVANRM